jgi:hypothetical protein
LILALLTIGGITAAAILANAIGIGLDLNAPTGHLLNIAWGPGAHDPQPIVASWILQTQDINGVEVNFLFHLASQDIPLLIGHNILQNSTINFNHH